MRYTQARIATRIDRLVAVRAKISTLHSKANDLVLAILSAGGGESRRNIAKIVRMPRKVVIVRAHKQVRTYAKP